MTDILAPRAKIGVMTPAMNTVVQPELELLRPQGITNQMQRFRLGGEQVSDDLFEEAEKLMDCNPSAISIALTTDAALGGVEKLSICSQQLSEYIGIPVFNASMATRQALRAVGARQIAVATPFNAQIDQYVKTNIELDGFEVVAIKGTEAPNLNAICETPASQVRNLINHLGDFDCDAIVQIGTALPIVSLINELEQSTGKTLIACNVAVYWQTLRALGFRDRFNDFGQLLSAF